MTTEMLNSSRPLAGGGLSRRDAILGCALLGVGAAATVMTPHIHEHGLGSERLADIIPTAVGSRRMAPGGSFVVPEKGAPDSIYDQILTRAYYAADLPPVMLLIAYGAAQSGLMKVHVPEVCYASAGYLISNRQFATVRTGSQIITARVFTARTDTRTEQVLTWARVSDAFPRSLTEQRLVMVERGMRGIIPDGVLVRMSMISGDVQASRSSLTQFAEQMIQTAGARGRTLLLGRVTPSGPAVEDRVRPG